MAAAIHTFPFVTRCGYYLLDPSPDADKKIVVLHNGTKPFFPGESPLYLLGKYALFKDRVENYHCNASYGFRALGPLLLESMVTKEALGALFEGVEERARRSPAYARIESQGFFFQLAREDTGAWLSLNYEIDGRSGPLAAHSWILVAPEWGDVTLPREITPAFLAKCQLDDLLNTAAETSSLAIKNGVRLSVGAIVKTVEMLFARWREVQLLFETSTSSSFVLRAYKGTDCYTNTLSVEKKTGDHYELDFHCTRGKRKGDPLVGEGGDAKVYHSFRMRAGAPSAYACVVYYGSLEETRRTFALYKKYRDVPVVHVYTRFAPFVKGTGCASTHILESLYPTDLGRVVREIGLLSIAESLSVLVDALTVLAAMHKDGMAHRDIKTANFLVLRRAEGRMQIRVTDFARAVYFDNYDEISSISSTINILEPEFIPLVQEHGLVEYHPSYKVRNVEKADMWALGIVFYEILTRRDLFAPAADVAGLLASILRDSAVENFVRKKLASIYPSRTWPEEVILLLEALLERDPEKRINARTALARAKELLDAMPAAAPPAAAAGGSGSSPS